MEWTTKALDSLLSSGPVCLVLLLGFGSLWKAYLKLQDRYLALLERHAFESSRHE